MTNELVPPSTELTPPQPVKPVSQDQAGQMVKIEPVTMTKLDEKVKEFTETVIQSDVQSDPFKERVNAIHNLGSKEIRASASVSNRMLDKPVRSMEGGLFNDTTPISRSLVDLRKTVEDLDPSHQGDLFSPQRLMGIIPFGNKLRDYFLRYQSSQSHINAIINALYKGQDELRKDNAAIEQEKVNLWELMGQLQQYVYVGKKIDAALEDRVASIEATDPEKARIVKEEMLFYVRQKVQDLLTQQAVNIQGYLALDMVRRNNLELIKGVDRATTTTVSALRTAVIVAQALANQKLVLDQISALNTTTSSLIESTSQLLRKQTVDIHEQASSATLNIESLQRAFNNIYESMDEISNYKVQALTTMQQTVNTLSTEIEKANTYLDRVRREEAARAAGEADLLGPDNEIKL
ncbi:MAG TPA: toxic anion resistance protein [Anaerolineaceae bacterium]|nr:toxic anion resistance protein [Anaerolineaceae bacterium]